MTQLSLLNGSGSCMTTLFIMACDEHFLCRAATDATWVPIDKQLISMARLKTAFEAPNAHLPSKDILLRDTSCIVVCVDREEGAILWGREGKILTKKHCRQLLTADHC